MNKKTDNYIPYGPEWEKEMMKLPKAAIIGMLRKAKAPSTELDEFLEDNAVAFAEWIILNANGYTHNLYYKGMIFGNSNRPVSELYQLFKASLKQQP